MIAPRDAQEELVSDSARCPGCGEARVDYLEWIDDQTVRCHSCGRQYQPMEGSKDA